MELTTGKPNFLERHRNSLVTLFSTLALAGTVGCKWRAPTETSARSKSASSSADKEFTLTDYARECEQALGPIPSFSCSPVDEIILWTKNAQGQIVRVGAEDIPGKQVAYQPGQTCFNPSMSGPPEHRCIPHVKIGAWPKGADADVTWIVDCRRANLLFGPTEDKWESVGIIGHRKSTGQTCFFDTKRKFVSANGQIVNATLEQLNNGTTFHPISGENLPVPGAPGSDNYWLTPREMGESGLTRCVRCHAAYPFIRNSTIQHRKVALALGAQAPESYFNSDGGIPKNFESIKEAKKVPYVVVGQQGLESVSEPGMWQPTQVVSKDGCTNCHRIGIGFQVRQAAQSVGHCDKKYEKADVHCKGLHPDITKTALTNWHKAIFEQADFPDIHDGAMPETPRGKSLHTGVRNLFFNCFLNNRQNPEGCPLEPVR